MESDGGEISADKGADATMFRAMELTLYIKPWCPWCVEAVRWMRERNYVFREVDVLKSAEAYAHMRKVSGQSLTPTLETSTGLVLPDFDVRQLEKFLEVNKITP